jgi:hypothetical protein
MVPTPEPPITRLQANAPAPANAPMRETSKAPRPIKLHRGYLRVIPRSGDVTGERAAPAS